MYRVLASSRATVNVHGYIDAAAPEYAANLRLYEATGMGALLVTDRMRNLGQLFEVGREVVDYANAVECAEVISYYMEYPAEAAAIAAAGQVRTLRDHTWRDRMERLVEMIQRRM
jgi:spore maturation protein CgeB